MKLTKKNLFFIIENYLFEDEEEDKEIAGEAYDFGDPVEVEMNNGSTVKFESSDKGGVTVKIILPSGHEEDPITINKEDVDGDTENKERFSISAGGALMRMGLNGRQSDLEKILKKLNDLIDLTPVLSLRSALVHHDSLVLRDKST